jgi:hypothetical protein
MKKQNKIYVKDYNRIFNQVYSQAIKDINKIINESKCYCELCAFGGEHESDEDDKLIKSIELKQALKELGEK